MPIKRHGGGAAAPVLTGDAVVANVVAGKTFYKDDASTKLTGTLALTGDAIVGNVLADKTFYKDDTASKLTGTMVNNGAVSTDISAKATEVTIAAGYHNGSGKVKIATAEQDKVIAENIKKDTVILGVTGTMVGAAAFPTFATTINILVEPTGGGAATTDQTETNPTLTRGFYNLVAANAGLIHSDRDISWGAGHINVKTTGGTVHGYDGRASYNNALENIAGTLGAAGGANKGMQVGTGTDAESFESYALQTQIAHGTGAGQLSYGAESMGALAYDAGTKTVSKTRVRVLTNTSGNTINIAEIGTCIRITLGGVNVDDFLVDRKKLSSAVAVPNNYKATITFTRSMVFPA